MHVSSVDVGWIFLDFQFFLNTVNIWKHFGGEERRPPISLNAGVSANNSNKKARFISSDRANKQSKRTIMDRFCLAFGSFFIYNQGPIQDLSEGGARFISEQNFLRSILFLFCTRFFFPKSAIEKLFWNLRGATRTPLNPSRGAKVLPQPPPPYPPLNITYLRVKIWLNFWTAKQLFKM